MAELWVPNLNEQPDLGNLYDMMLVYQEQLDTVSDPEDMQSWRAFAIGALRALSVSIQDLSFKERQVNVATNLAIVRRTDDPSKQWRVEDVGLRGSIDDVHCMKLGRAAKPTLALGLDVESFYPLTDSRDGDLMLTTATAPISQVNYIETAA